MRGVGLRTANHCVESPHCNLHTAQSQTQHGKKKPLRRVGLHTANHCVESDSALQTTAQIRTPHCKVQTIAHSRTPHCKPLCAVRLRTTNQCAQSRCRNHCAETDFALCRTSKLWRQGNTVFCIKKNDRSKKVTCMTTLFGHGNDHGDIVGKFSRPLTDFKRNQGKKST